MGERDKIPEGNRKTAISDEEKARIIKRHGTHKLTREEWIKELNKQER